MSNSEYSSSSRKKKSQLSKKVDSFSKSVGLSPLRIVVSGILLLGIGFLIFSVAFSDRDNNKVADKPSEISLQKQELSIDQQLDEMMNRKVRIDQNFLATIDQIYEIDEQIEKIESESELSESQKILIDRIRLRNKSTVVMLLTRNKVSSDLERAELFKFSKERLESSDEQIRELARYLLCVVPTVEFSESPSAETLNSFTTAIETYTSGYINSPKHANTISSLIFNLSKKFPHAKEHWKPAFSALSKQLAKSESESIRNMGKRLDGLEIFGEFNLSSLRQRILWGDPTGPGDLKGAFGVLAQHPDTDLGNWVAIIKAYESFLSTDKIEETGSAWQQMKDLSSNVSDSEKKKTLQGILARQRARAMAIGAPFELSGTTLPDGSPLTIGEQDYTAIIFCNKSQASLNMMRKLAANKKESQLGFRIVLAFENQLTEADIKSLDMVPRDISIVDFKTAKTFYEVLPIDFFPYVVLLGKNGTIVSMNLDVQQIPMRVAKFNSIERKAREANSTKDATITQ